MPLYFKELEKAFIKWYNINNIKKPTGDPASWVTYKSMRKFAKKKIVKIRIEIIKKY